MKFSLNKSEFAKGLDVVSKGLSALITEPVLAGIHIEATNDMVIFRSSTGILSIQYETSALVEEEGKCVTPGKALINMIKSFPDCSIQIETEGNQMKIECGSSKPVLNSIDSELFPAFPHAEVNTQVKLPFETLAKLVKEVSHVVSKDEDRQILTGIYIAVENKKITLFATDSYRIASTSVDLNDEVENFEAVIPGAFLLDIVSLPLDDEFITISLSENQIIIECNNTIFINRRIEGTFPPCKQLEPSSYAMQLEISTKNFTDAIKRNIVIAESDGTVIVKGDPNAGFVKLESPTQEVGKFNEEVECSGSGEEMQIAFRNSHIVDGLKSISSETFLFEVEANGKTGVLRSMSEDENFWYLLLPVRI